MLVDQESIGCVTEGDFSFDGHAFRCREHQRMDPVDLRYLFALSASQQSRVKGKSNDRSAAVSDSPNRELSFWLAQCAFYGVEPARRTMAEAHKRLADAYRRLRTGQNSNRSYFLEGPNEVTDIQTRLEGRWNMLKLAAEEREADLRQQEYARRLDQDKELMERLDYELPMAMRCDWDDDSETSSRFYSDADKRDALESICGSYRILPDLSLSQGESPLRERLPLTYGPGKRESLRIYPSGGSGGEFWCELQLELSPLLRALGSLVPDKQRPGTFDGFLCAHGGTYGDLPVFRPGDMILLQLDFTRDRRLVQGELTILRQEDFIDGRGLFFQASSMLNDCKESDRPPTPPETYHRLVSSWQREYGIMCRRIGRREESDRTRCALGQPLIDEQELELDLD